MTSAGKAPNPEVEVSDKARRRRFTAEYKREILRRADACKEPGALGALLRAEGLYSSHLGTWRRQRETAELAGLTPKKRGRKAREVDARDRQIAELEQKVSRLTTRAERAEALVELQKSRELARDPVRKRQAMMNAVTETSSNVGGIAAACAALGMPRATYYRRLHPTPPEALSRANTARREQPRALRADEREDVLAILNEPRFVDLAAPQVYAMLLDEGRRLCSLRTMYRILDANRLIRERRDQLRHPEYKKPELLATGPNQVWTWDITKLLGPAKWTYFYLYVILDIFSRYVVGWTVATSESSLVATALIEEACRRHGIKPDQLTLHADRGSPMISKPVAFLLADLAVTKSHSRPHVSDDNPFSEAQFKTLKYRQIFLGDLDPSTIRSNTAGTSSPGTTPSTVTQALAFHTPADVHYGHAEHKRQQRMAVLDAAFRAHPERFPLGPPKPPALPSAVWINRPQGVAAAGGSAGGKLVVLAAPSGGALIEAVH